MALNKDLINSGASDLSTYDDYVNTIKMNKLNAQSELSASQEKSNALMNNYLKALGVYGSCLGQTAYAQNNANYDKMINESNQAYDNSLTSFRENTFKNLNSMASDLYNSGVSRDSYEKLISGMGERFGSKDYYDALSKNLQTDEEKTKAENEQTRKTAYDSIVGSIQKASEDPDAYAKLSQYADIIKNADVNSDEFKKAVEAYDDYISGIDTYKLDKELGIKDTKGFATSKVLDRLEDEGISKDGMLYKLIQGIANADKLQGKETETNDTQSSLSVGNEINESSPLWEQFSKLDYSASKLKNILDVKYNGKTYSINRKTKKIVSVN